MAELFLFAIIHLNSGFLGDKLNLASNAEGIASDVRGQTSTDGDSSLPASLPVHPLSKLLSAAKEPVEDTKRMSIGP